MNLGIGYSLFAGFFQSEIYSVISIAASLFMLVCPFVFWKFRRHAGIFICCMGAAFSAVMLFSLFLYQLNADECQHLLMAHSVINGGVPFRDFEAQGLGPFNGFYLALFSFGNISFVTARLGALFAELAGGIMIFLAVRRLSGIRPAIAIASPVFFYFSVFSSYTDLWEITSYNCETLFFLLLSIWFVLFAYRGSSRLVMFLEFFVLGMWPWVKLQFAPFSLICFVLSIARGIFVQDGSGDAGRGEGSAPGALRSRLFSWDFLLACLAAVMPTALFLAYLALNGALERFWLFYIVDNMEHVSVPLDFYFTFILPYLVLEATRPMFWLAICTAAAFFVLVLCDYVYGRIHGRGSRAAGEGGAEAAARPSGAGRSELGSVLLALFALTALFSVTRTMSHYYHYLNIIVPAGAVFAGLGMSLTGSERKRGLWALVMIAVSALAFCPKMVFLNNVRTFQQKAFISESIYPFSKVLHYLNERVKPGEPVPLWGWEPGFLIYSDHPSATATHFIYPLVSDKFTPRIRDAYVEDIIKNRPAAIVDLVCPYAFSFRDSKFELSNYGFIKRVTDEYYEKPVAVPVGSSGFARVYLRKPGM